MNTNLIAEAIYQMKAAKESGIKAIHTTNIGVVVAYNNGTISYRENNDIAVQWERNSKLYVCKL